MIICRREYMDKLRLYRDTELIKAVTGARRCGKSTLLQTFQTELRRQGIPAGRLSVLITTTSGIWNCGNPGIYTAI